MPFCCCGSSSKPSDISHPPVQKKPTSANETYDRNNLPPGALLTGAQKLHAASLTGKGVRVAVIDSGIDKQHPGFEGMVKKQEWYRAGSSLEEDDHGTHVAGTIHFMAPDAELYDYRVFGATGRVSVDEAIRQAILQAVEDGCHVINMSLGGPVPTRKIEQAVKAATAKGVLCVCAAGNSGDGDPLTNERSYPAQYEECLSIAAVSKASGLPVARFSNSNVGVDHAGIGVDVISFKPGGGFQSMSGTSMACPHVCGFIAALLTGGNGKATDIRKRLAEEFTLDIGIVGPDNSTGLGFVTKLEKEELESFFAVLGISMKGPSASVY